MAWGMMAKGERYKEPVALADAEPATSCSLRSEGSSYRSRSCPEKFDEPRCFDGLMLQ